MYPELTEIGPFTIYTLWVFLAAGFFVALLLINKLVQKNRMSLKFVTDHSVLIFIGALLMSRLIFVARNFDAYFSDISFNSFLQIFFIWDKGLSPWGAVLGILLTMIFFAYKTKEDILKWLDIFSVAILAAIALADVGAFFDGSHFGNETNLPWGILFDNSLYAVPIHPTQLYAAIYSGIMAFYFFRLVGNRKTKYAGHASLLILLIFSICRFLEEFVRGDETNIILGLREAQIYALIGIAASLIILNFSKIKAYYLKKFKH